MSTTKHLSNRYQQYLKNPDSTASARNSLLEICLMLLKETEHAPRQCLDTMFIDILIDSSKAATFDPDKAAEAFCRIQEYVELLYRYPWKQEFWTLKYHCGFYRTMINPWLKRAEEIFKKIGYHIVNGNCFQLQNEPNAQSLIDIGSQCLLASAECSLLSEACRLADTTNYMPTLVLHLDHGGTSKDIVAKLRTNNERMFIDPDKDLYISDLPLEYSYMDLRRNSHSLKQHPNPKSLQSLGQSYGPSHPLGVANDIYLTQRTYTEEQQAAFDSYRRPVAPKPPHYQPVHNKPEPFRRVPAVSAVPAVPSLVLPAGVPIIATDNLPLSNCDRDSAYGDSTYEDSTFGDSLHRCPSDVPPPSYNLLSHTLRRPREPTEHSLEKPAEDDDPSPPERTRTLTPTQLTQSASRGEAEETESRLPAPFSSLPITLSSSSQSSAWICKVCNYNNMTDELVCKICSESRSPGGDGEDTAGPPSSPQPIQPRNSERICEKCTLKNKVTARKCTACGQTFKGYHTAV